MGAFGCKIDNSNQFRYPRLVEKSITFFRRLGEFCCLFAIFPQDSPKFFITYFFRRARAVL